MLHLCWYISGDFDASYICIYAFVYIFLIYTNSIAYYLFVAYSLWIIVSMKQNLATSIALKYVWCLVSLFVVRLLYTFSFWNVNLCISA